jgi:hypothetical protein
MMERTVIIVDDQIFCNLSVIAEAGCFHTAALNPKVTGEDVEDVTVVYSQSIQRKMY